MGYYMSQFDSKFTIRAENKEKALQAIKDLTKPEIMEKLARGGSFSGGEVKERWYSWTDTDRLRNAKTIEDAIGEWGWDTTLDEVTGDIVGIFFPENKQGQEDIMFQAIAPYVEKGSYLHMIGEDGNQWRWSFTGKKMKEQNVKSVEWE